MIIKQIGLFLGLVCSSSAAENQITELNDVQWLGWALTAYPVSELQYRHIAPKPTEGFKPVPMKNIILGLRPDGTVVWKASSENIKPHNNAQTSTLYMWEYDDFLRYKSQ